MIIFKTNVSVIALLEKHWYLLTAIWQNVQNVETNLSYDFNTIGKYHVYIVQFYNGKNKGNLPEAQLKFNTYFTVPTKNGPVRP